MNKDNSFSVAFINLREKKSGTWSFKTRPVGLTLEADIKAAEPGMIGVCELSLTASNSPVF